MKAMKGAYKFTKSIGGGVVGGIVSGIKSMGTKNSEDTSLNDLQNGEISGKDKYMSKYGLQFTIPSVNVQCSAWYPSNPEYFVQIVSYAVPKHDEYVVETHYMEHKPKTVSNFEEMFKE